jgi:hypothetical protein
VDWDDADAGCVVAAVSGTKANTPARLEIHVLASSTLFAVV